MFDKVFSYGKQVIEEDDIQAVIETLRGDWLTQGPKVAEFERSLSEYLGAPRCTVTSNGTGSLHLIALGLGWKAGDVIITSPITFLASANCALYVNATPEFADIHPDTYTIDPAEVEKKILFHRCNNRTVRAIIAVDFAGNPCDWESLSMLVKKYDVQLVNDHCHAIGSIYNHDPCFAVKYADAVNLSFHPVKHITSGEGGAILTRHTWLDDKVKILRTHGMTKDPQLLTTHEGSWYYEMISLGYNYRITDFQCALGITQLKKLNRFLEARRFIASYYDEAFKNDERFIIPEIQTNSTHAYHLYPLRIRFAGLKITKKEFFEKLKRKNILCQVHYIPVHLQPYYRNTFGFKRGDFPVAEQFYNEEVSIPCYPSLEKTDLDFIIQSIREEAA